MARKAQDLTFEKRILAVPGPRKVYKISREVIDTVKDFYEDDKFSMMMPGTKDRISIKKNECEQKRLLLGNLKELYFAFKEKYSEFKIGFSTFCCLRPKWCVLAGYSCSMCLLNTSKCLPLSLCNKSKS